MTGFDCSPLCSNINISKRRVFICPCGTSWVQRKLREIKWTVCFQISGDSVLWWLSLPFLRSSLQGLRLSWPEQGRGMLVFISLRLTDCSWKSWTSNVTKERAAGIFEKWTIWSPPPQSLFQLGAWLRSNLRSDNSLELIVNCFSGPL